MIESLYKSLVKTPLSLQQRAVFADSVASQVRQNIPTIWDKISLNESRLLPQLQHLEQKGFLSLSFSRTTELINDLVSLSPAEFLDPHYTHSSESFHLENVNKLPSVVSLLNDPSLYALVSLYLNAPARISDCLAWWHFPMPPDIVGSNAQKWHRDRDDFAELKLFMYATDVDQGSGPHAFIPGSHKHTNLSKLFPKAKSDDPVISAKKHTFLSNTQLTDYGLDDSNVKPWLGPKGTTFLEDTRGLHRAYRPTNKPRLIFSIVWTVANGIIPDIY